MNCEVIVTERFKKSVKPLLKKYRSLKKELADFLESLETNPLQGTEIISGVRKIRLSILSKGKGKSGSARVITYNIILSQESGIVYVVEMYDKSEFDSVDKNRLRSIIKDIDLSL